MARIGKCIDKARGRNEGRWSSTLGLLAVVDVRILSRADMGRRLPCYVAPGTGEFAGYPIAEFSWSSRSPNILIRLLASVVR